MCHQRERCIHVRCRVRRCILGTKCTRCSFDVLMCHMLTKKERSSLSAANCKQCNFRLADARETLFEFVRTPAIPNRSTISACTKDNVSFQMFLFFRPLWMCYRFDNAVANANLIFARRCATAYNGSINKKTFRASINEY